ncbi:MAG: glycosyltransferase family 39 protein [Phycisphaerae bacterium]|nr:glycosyltransferase family 39 protein [Phycisphaerae bacterium]
MSTSTVWEDLDPMMAASARRRWWITRTGLLVVLLIAAVLRFWNLEANEFGNLYYAAAVRSMAASWHNFLYASFDPAGFVSLDKPPVAFWLQVLSVKVLGYSGFALHLPQALEGSIAVLVVYLVGRRLAGDWGGLLAGLVMAVTPASVAIDRSNLPDSCLLLVLLVAGSVLLRATERARWGWLLVATAIVGLGFNVKLTAAYLVLPSFYLVYWLGALAARGTRVAHLAAATVVLVMVSLSWPLFVDLSPADARPYVGDTQTNSVLGLAFHLQGLQRMVGNRPPPGSGPSSPPVTDRTQPGPRMPGPPFARGPGTGEEEFTGHGGHPGPLRLANRDLAGHVTWLVPFAAIGAACIVSVLPRWRPLSPMHQNVLLWGGWFVTYAVAFSLSDSPIHPYYLTLVAAPVAILTGLAAKVLWDTRELSGNRSSLLALALLATAGWQIWTAASYPVWGRWLAPMVLSGTGAGAVLLLVSGGRCWSPTTTRNLGAAGMVVGLAALLLCPAVWSATPVLAPGGRMVPVADPILLERRNIPVDSAEAWRATRVLAAYLDHRRGKERYLLAVPDIHAASPLIIDSSARVMAYGGFSGTDPILSAAQFSEMVKEGELRFVLLSSEPRPGRPVDHRDAIAAWVREHGREVPRAEWMPIEPRRNDSRLPPSPWGEVSAMLLRLYQGPGCRLYECGPAGTATGAAS